MAYGKELILDLYGCNAESFTRHSIECFLIGVCELVDMQREDLHFWDYLDCPEEKEKAPEHLVGTSAVQFITTSDIVIHTVDKVGECYINLFTCKDFDPWAAADYARKWFSAKEYDHHVIVRGARTKCKI